MWHLDEVFINGQRPYLWRAVDPQGNVLDILVQSRRDATAAERFFRKLLKKFAPRVLITDKLCSYGVAHRRLMSSVEHRKSKYLNRAENSHQPTRQRLMPECARTACHVGGQGRRLRQRETVAENRLVSRCHPAGLGCGRGERAGIDRRRRW
jgi:transposase-like protein